MMLWKRLFVSAGSMGKSKELMKIIIFNGSHRAGTEVDGRS